MPTEPAVLPMSPEAYRAMAHRLGWKHEYLDGAARLVPSESAIVIWERSLRAPEAFRAPADGAGAARGGDQGADPGGVPREAVPGDRDALVELFVVAFDDGPEYCGHSDDAYREDAERTADGGGRIHVLDGDDALLGAIVVTDRGGLPTVEPVMVAPAARRRGVATALLRAAIGAAVGAGATRLRSHSHLANAGSVAWHAASGFAEVPYRSTVSARLQHARWMAEHHGRAGNAAAAARERAEAARLAEALEGVGPRPDPFGGLSLHPRASRHPRNPTT